MKPDIYINEDLTPRRSTVMYVLRKLRRSHSDKVTGCSSAEGVVYAWVKPLVATVQNQRDIRMRVNGYDNLVEFCNTYIGKPLGDFLDTWPH